MQETDWKSDICALRNGKFPWDGNSRDSHKVGNSQSSGNSQISGISGEFQYGKFPGGKSLKPYGREGAGISRWTSLPQSLRQRPSHLCFSHVKGLSWTNLNWWLIGRLLRLMSSCCPCHILPLSVSKLLELLWCKNVSSQLWCVLSVKRLC